ncbi:baseplate wedge protein [Xanthomonas phage X1]|nr:baseplate wedge protein [Xanthomonas phage X1]
MAYSFTPSIKPYVISSLYEAMKSARPSARTPSTSYSLGAQVSNGNNRYICMQEGVTGAGNGPSNTTGAVYDGTVRWLALGADNVQDGDVISNLYLGVGKQTEWANPSTPDAPDTSLTGQNEALDDLTALIKIDSSNLRLGLKNNTWTTGTIYSQYDPDVVTYATPNYAIVGGTYVYKCLDNNNGIASTDAPTGTSTSLIETADGYIWKYVGSVSGPEMFTFGTTEFVPAPTEVNVTTVQGEISSFTDMVSTSTPFASADTIRVVVQGNGTGASGAARSTTSGASKTLTGLYATAGGSNYTEAYAIAYKDGTPGTGATLAATIDAGKIDTLTVSSPGSAYTSASVVIIGDGTGAEATVVVSSGIITAVNITEEGSGYTWAKAFIIPGTAGGVAKANLSPPGGHGSNLDTELGIASVLVSARLSASLSNYIPTEPSDTDGSFRQVTLVSGVRGTTKNALAYVGPSHPDYVSGSQAKYLKGSGFVLYMNNIVAIEHTSSQEEVIKISISL